MVVQGFMHETAMHRADAILRDKAWDAWRSVHRLLLLLLSLSLLLLLLLLS